MDDVMLTTIDNKFDPFTEWDDWKGFDEDDMGYYTCAYLARVAKTSDDLSDADNEKAINDAIDEIVALNINGMYRKAFRKKEGTGGEV